LIFERKILDGTVKLSLISNSW